MLQPTPSHSMAKTNCVSRDKNAIKIYINKLKTVVKQ